MVRKKSGDAGAESSIVIPFLRNAKSIDDKVAFLKSIQGNNSLSDYDRNLVGRVLERYSFQKKAGETKYVDGVACFNNGNDQQYLLDTIDGACFDRSSLSKTPLRYHSAYGSGIYKGEYDFRRGWARRDGEDTYFNDGEGGMNKASSLLVDYKLAKREGNVPLMNRIKRILFSTRGKIFVPETHTRIVRRYESSGFRGHSPELIERTETRDYSSDEREEMLKQFGGRENIERMRKLYQKRHTNTPRTIGFNDYLKNEGLIKKGYNHCYYHNGGLIQLPQKFENGEYHSVDVKFQPHNSFDNIKSQRNKIAQRVGVTMAVAGLGASIFFIGSNFTGNVIGSLSVDTTNLIGVGAFLIGIVGSMLCFKRKK